MQTYQHLAHRLKTLGVTFLILLAAALLLQGCGNDKKAAAGDKAQKKTVVVTTSFLDDMVHKLAGDYVNVEMIIPAGEDPHLYVAKPADLEKLKKADLVLYHGLHFEGKMVEILEKKGHAVAYNFPKDEIGRMEEDGKMVTDPHFWFNIKLYKMAVVNVAEQLEKLVPDKKADIEKNKDKYLKQLDELHTWAQKELDKIPAESRYVITPHDAFNYFARQYGVKVKAPQGVSTDSEVSNKDLQDTVNFIVAHKVKAIFAESTTDPARMKKLQEACKAQGWDVKVVHGEGNELLADSLAPKGHPGDNYIDMVKHDVNLMVKNLA